MLHNQDRQSQILNFYSLPAFMTDVTECKPEILQLSDSVETIAAVVQGLLIHGHWLKRYGIENENDRRAVEMNIRSMGERIKRIKENNPMPLSSPRDILHRQIGCCRDFTLMFVAFLRLKGIPARARCGFGRYFLPDHYEDHWVAEYYDRSRRRWIMVDPQIDELQRTELALRFNPLDMPSGQFVTGGEAWILVREKGYNPDLFGIFACRGIDFILGDFVRDVASLGKIELLPWDCWGAMERKVSDLSADELSELDEIARMTMSVDDNFDKIIKYAESDTRFHPGKTIGTFWGSKYSRVDIMF